MVDVDEVDAGRALRHTGILTPVSPPDHRPDLARLRAERLGKVRASMAEQGVDALVLLHGPHVAYATGHLPDAVDVGHAVHCRPVAIVTADDVRVHAPCAELPPLWPELDERAPAFAAAVADAVGDIGGRRIGVDELTGAMRRGGVLDGAELVDAARVLGPARLRKTADELACIDLAQRRNEEAMLATQEAAVPGARRSEVAGVFLRRLVELGGTPNLIDPIFEVVPRRRDGGWRTSTGHIAFPTGVGDPTFAEGDLVWVDTGVGVHGYASDFGRTWVIGRDPTDVERRLFDRWQAVMAAVLAVLGPAASLGDLCRAAEAADEAEGGDGRPWLPHFYLGHGVGVESAEMPLAGTDLGREFDDGFRLEPGMVLVLEPVAWEDGVGGYRAEEVVAVTDDGHRILGGGHHHRPFAGSGPS
jgi:Xaa-Pro aminopeptidase